MILEATPSAVTEINPWLSAAARFDEAVARFEMDRGLGKDLRTRAPVLNAPPPPAYVCARLEVLAATVVVTAQPLDLGGSRGRPEATGRGCMIVTMQALRKLGLEPTNTRVVVQGFGNVGGMSAKLMARAGFKIICVIELDGAVFNPHGLDIEALMKHFHETGSITGFSEGEDIDPHDALYLDCEVLLPAAKENVITSANTDRIKARIICEGANGPTTSEADAILADKNIFVLPDILANAGGVTVSYFEWVQDRQGYFWNEQLVNGRLEEIMVNSF